MITKEQAINSELREIHYFNPDLTIAGMTKAAIERYKTCHKWRRNGKTKTWKTRPNDFRVPIKLGLYEYGYLTQENANNFFFSDECPNRENHVRTKNN